MARTPLRRRILSMTLIYSVMLIGIVFILTWRTHNTQKEIERIVMLQSEAVEVLNTFKVFHAGLQSTWSRIDPDHPGSFVDGEKYLALSAQYRDQLRQAEGAPPVLAFESESLDRLVSATSQGWAEASPAERRASLEALSGQTQRIVTIVGDAIHAAKLDVDRSMEALVRQGRNTMWTALGAAYIIAVFGFAVARNALKKVVTPLEDLSRAANGLAEGEYDTRAPIGGDLEIAQLGRAFNQMAAKIETAVNATEHKARTDDLTGLPNFRSFSEMIDEEIARSGRYEYRFGLLIFDIDHFKKYNDSYGHLAGNDALQLVASTIQQTLRTVDKAARYGGEEFAAILPQVDEENIRMIGERARRAVQNLPPIEDRRRLTVSIGAAIFPHDGRSADALFQAADKRLYEAKDKGRNRVITPEPRQLRRA